MALAAKWLYSTDSRSGKLQDIVHVNWFAVKLLLYWPLLCPGQVVTTLEISLRAYVLEGTFSRTNSRVFSARFAKSLTCACVEFRCSNNIIFIWGINWIHLMQSGFLSCWCLLTHSALGSWLLGLLSWFDISFEICLDLVKEQPVHYSLRKPLSCLQNYWNRDCPCCKLSRERPLLVCLLRGLGLWTARRYMRNINSCMAPWGLMWPETGWIWGEWNLWSRRQRIPLWING